MRLFNNYRELRDALDEKPEHPDAFRFLPEYAPACFKCDECGEWVALVTDGNACGTGYGLEPVTDAMVCYPCCGKRDRQRLEREGKGYLYLNEKTGTLSNWCGSLVLQAKITSRFSDKVCFKFELPRLNMSGTSVQSYDQWAGTLHRKNDNMLTLVKRSVKCKP